MGDKTFAQLTDIDFHFQPAQETNSIAVIIQHMHGNMLSRWTNFLTEDGEKPWRKRDAEFDNEKLHKEQLLHLWEEGWQLVFNTLNMLQEEDLTKTIYIRSQPLFVIDAVIRQIDHYGYHTGQIVQLGKIIKDHQWQSLSIPKNKSKDFNTKMQQQNNPLMNPAAIIFDLDGTLIDNNYYHIEAWKVFYKQHGLEFSMEDYRNNINGKINRDIFNYILGTTLSAEDLAIYDSEKEALYRELYAPHIEPVTGLIELLMHLNKEGIPTAVATSGLPPNINFMFEHIPMRQYFGAVINASDITHGKPHPEIFLKAAASHNAHPELCIAFEDSVAGIRSAKAAGMKVIALVTTHKREELSEADYIINNYTEISLEAMKALLNQ